MRIITSDTDGVVQNADGSVTVQSGAIEINDPAEESKPLTYEEWLARMEKIADRNGRETMTFYRNPQGLLLPVSVVYVGLGRSKIQLNGSEALVATSNLIWETEAPADKLLAVINAPKTGQAKMRSKAKVKSTVLATCRTNQVVRVLKIGSSWTFVDYGGLRGYIQTSSLTFYDNQPRSYVTGYISVKGKTPAGETVYIRAAAKNNSRHLEEYPVSTPLTIFSENGDWMEIDVEGWHCYILSKYVTLDNVNKPAALSAELEDSNFAVVPTASAEGDEADPDFGIRSSALSDETREPGADSAAGMSAAPVTDAGQDSEELDYGGEIMLLPTDIE